MRDGAVTLRAVGTLLLKALSSHAPPASNSWLQSPRRRRMTGRQTARRDARLRRGAEAQRDGSDCWIRVADQKSRHRGGALLLRNDLGSLGRGRRQLPLDARDRSRSSSLGVATGLPPDCSL
jgi:hypothetical protein